MQAVAPTKRQPAKQPTFSSLKSKNDKSNSVNADLPKSGREGESKTQLGAPSLSNGTGNGLDVNAVSATQLLSNKMLLERNQSN